MSELINRPARGVRPKEAWQRIGCGNTKGYQLIAEGKLDARRCGGMTILTEESINAFLAGLPSAAVGAKAPISKVAA